MVRWKTTEVVANYFRVLKFQSYFWWMVRWKIFSRTTIYENGKVSILLLVDGALEEYDLLINVPPGTCFNPTFGGWCAGSILSALHSLCF